MRVGFPCRAWAKHLKSPRPDGLGGYERVIPVILQCKEWGLRYFNLPSETIGWGDYSKYKPGLQEMEEKFGELLAQIRNASETADVMLSMHAAAYNVPTSDDPVVLERSLREIVVMQRALEMCGGSVLYLHPGYGGKDAAAACARLVGRLSSLPASSIPLGIETSGVGLGDLDTVLHLASAIPGALPVMDFGHLYGLGWSLGTINDYTNLFERARLLSGKYIFTHFSAVSGRKHIPLEGNLPDFRVFARAAAAFERQGNQQLVVLIESPRRELDALLFRGGFQRALAAAQVRRT
ncbi:MAG TPA: TIM barrel protein [Armatimonadota bacterium]|nr:TIM barrel protein [Armatimonadota bacterium]